MTSCFGDVTSVLVISIFIAIIILDEVLTVFNDFPLFILFQEFKISIAIFIELHPVSGILPRQIWKNTIKKKMGINACCSDVEKAVNKRIMVLIKKVNLCVRRKKRTSYIKKEKR